MKNKIAKVFTSSVYASFLGSTVVLVGMLSSFMVDGEGLFSDAIAGALLFYFATAIVACIIALFAAGPVYLVLAKYNLANYYTSIFLGLIVTFICFGFSSSLENIYWNLAGGVVGLLFHYQYTKKPN